MNGSFRNREVIFSYILRLNRSPVACYNYKCYLFIVFVGLQKAATQPTKLQNYHIEELFMETYLPIIQATLDEWLQLTLDHPLYAAALVISVWLLTALLYGIRIAGLNKKNVASETARTAAETNLNTTQQQLQQAQTELAAVTEQLEKQQQATTVEKQRALSAEQQHAQRNQQIAAIIQRLASSFDIGERPLAVTEDLKANDLWQQHDKVINQLIEALRTEKLAKTELDKFYQAEQSKVAEIEASLSKLQTNLNTQIGLVLALQTQNATLQQQQDSLQQVLADTQRKHQIDLARLLELERQTAQFANAQTQLEAIKDTLTTTPAPSKTLEQVTESTDKTAGNLKNLFKKPEQQTVVREDNVIIPPQEIPAPVSTDTVFVLAEDEQIVADDVVVVDSPETKKGSVLTGWYRKLTTKKPKPAEVVTEPVVVVEPVFEPIPEPIVPEPEPVVEEVSEKTSNVSALKGLYQKFSTAKPEPVEIQPEPVAKLEPAHVEITPEKTSNVSALKGLYQKFATAKPEPAEIAPEPVAKPEPTPVEVTPEKANVAAPKNLYQKFTRKPAETKKIDDAPSSGIEEAADQITDKIEKVKNLYGKFFSKGK